MRLTLKTMGALAAAATVAVAVPAMADGGSSGEAVAEAIVKHVKAGDSKAILALLPPDEVLTRALTCDADDDDFAEDIAETRRDVDGIVKAYRGLKFKELDVEKRREVEAGKRLKGCVANEPLGWFEAELGFSRDEDIEVELLRVGERWYLIELSD